MATQQKRGVVRPVGGPGQPKPKDDSMRVPDAAFRGPAPWCPPPPPPAAPSASASRDAATVTPPPEEEEMDMFDHEVRDLEDLLGCMHHFLYIIKRR